jgi:hypothetical protein
MSLKLRPRIPLLLLFTCLEFMKCGGYDHKLYTNLVLVPAINRPLQWEDCDRDTDGRDDAVDAELVS